MANLPEKNITLVDEITSVPANSKLFVNANGEFRQATVNEVVKSSTVVTSAVENAINTAVEDSINSHFKQASGNPILLTDSADGTLIDFKAYGRSTQKQYSGKNILDYSRIKTTSANGATLTNNNDGSFTVSGSGVLSNAFNVYFDYSHEETVRLLKVGEIKLELNGVATTPYLYIQLRSGTSAYLQISSNDDVKTKNITQAMLDDENVCLRIGFYGASTGVTIVGGTMKPMLYQSEDNTYEPYVGGTASPSPNYPQAIKSVADSGWFDGELLQGYYNESGTFSSNTSYVCSKNLIPCNGGDKVKVVYAGKIGSITFNFYDKDMNVLSRPSNSSEVTEYEATSPTNAKYVHFMFREVNGTITPSTAKPITVTINGKYALKVKSVGKNLLNINQNNKTNEFSYTEFTNESIKATANVTTKGSFICSFSAYLENGKTYFFSQESTNLNSVYIYSDRLWGNNIGNVNVVTAPYYKHKADSGTYIIGYYSSVTSGTEYSVVKPMLRQAEIEDDTYEPYKETVTYIPLNEPLRSSLDGTVTDEISLSENKVTRRIVRKRIVTVSKNNSTDVNNYCYYCALGNVGRSNRGMSNNLPNLSLYEVSINGTENIGQYVSVEYSGVVYINVGKHLTENTVEGMTKWLSENPTYIQYELAEPIVETIEPVDIVTYDNVTYLTASDNAEMELEYPTSKVAGIASIGYSKGRKAEYEVELLKAQLLELQTAMVNSL